MTGTSLQVQDDEIILTCEIQSCGGFVITAGKTVCLASDIETPYFSNSPKLHSVSSGKLGAGPITGKAAEGPARNSRGKSQAKLLPLPNSLTMRKWPP
jgi:hypothetical protein